MTTAYIIDTIRTPRARKGKELSSVHPMDLFTYPLNEIVKRNNIKPEMIEDVVAGCVTQTGEQGWCVARAAILAAGWPHTVPGTTINRLCGSGQQACNFVASSIMAGTYELAIAGGLEHMTRCPMFSDMGGEDSPMLKKHHPDLVPQGLSAELVAEHFGFSREEIDIYAAESQQRAGRALEEGRFNKSIVPIPYTDGEGNTHTLTQDATVRASTTAEILSGLKPVFKEDGVITAGNASGIVDGAASILLASENKVKELSLKPKAKIISTAVIGSPPKIMLTGPIPASKMALDKAKLKAEDIDVWEVNEAFAPVAMAVIKELNLDHSKVNINGGGISLGHPLGATGAMLIGTAIDELERTDGKYALVTMCIGLGMGIATVIERV